MLHTQKYNLIKFAAEEAEKEKKNPIEGGVGSWLVDMLHPLSHPWSSRRAATAKEVNRATDNKEDTGFSAEHPLTSDVLYTGGGGLAGALLGGLGGAAYKLNSDSYSDTPLDVGVFGGGALGALAGRILGNVNRRGSITDAKDNYEEDKDKLEEGKVGEPDMNHSYLADVLLPLSGPYRRAEIDANKLLKGKGPQNKGENFEKNLNNTFAGLAASPISPLQIPAGVIENWVATNKTHNEIEGKNKEKE